MELIFYLNMTHPGQSDVYMTIINDGDNNTNVTAEVNDDIVIRSKYVKKLTVGIFSTLTLSSIFSILFNVFKHSNEPSQEYVIVYVLAMIVGFMALVYSMCLLSYRQPPAKSHFTYLCFTLFYLSGLYGWMSMVLQRDILCIDFLVSMCWFVCWSFVYCVMSVLALWNKTLCCNPLSSFFTNV